MQYKNLFDSLLHTEECAFDTMPFPIACQENTITFQFAFIQSLQNSLHYQRISNEMMTRVCIQSFVDIFFLKKDKFQGCCYSIRVNVREFSTIFMI